MRTLGYGNMLLVLVLLGCSSGSSQNPTAASPVAVPVVPAGSGGGTGIFVAGCNFSDLDQNYAFDIVVSGSDSVGQGQKLGATIYNRSGSIQGQFTVDVVPGPAGSSLLETIQSTGDGGTSFKIDISNTVSASQNPPIYGSNLVRAHLADGSQINNRGLLCRPGQLR